MPELGSLNVAPVFVNPAPSPKKAVAVTLLNPDRLVAPSPTRFPPTNISSPTPTPPFTVIAPVVAFVAFVVLFIFNLPVSAMLMLPTTSNFLVAFDNLTSLLNVTGPSN